MGLLDDAIREHLELKRRRGADPGEVARAEHEALDPVPRDQYEPGGDADTPLADVTLHDAPEAGLVAGGVPEDMPDELADEAVAVPESTPEPAVGGETQELDMRSVLGEEAEQHGAAPQAAPAPSRDTAVPPGAPAQGAEEDSLEWEIPGEGAEEVPLEEQEPADDVLEETPEFLRDTPEQERLWFEQRPPRDFDFDK